MVTRPTEAMEDVGTSVEGCTLVVLEGVDAGVEFDLPSGRATIGASSTCELRLSDSTVSSRHVDVEIVAGGVRVTDLGSTNGTYYLGTRVGEAVVSHGAVLRVGRVRLAVGCRERAGVAYSERKSCGALVGASPAMRRLYAALERIEAVEYTVLILGETGTGKELVAREVHNHSPRKQGPFEVLDCGAVAHDLIENELFGHVAGAFSGATRQHQGVFERAHGGTLFLDEVGELPLELQPKLLRALENRQVRPLGAGATIDIDVRLVAATHRDLSAAVGEGRFREDLYFRINVVPLQVPPLRARREDIPPLIDAILEQLGTPDAAISSDTLEVLTSGYDWPGNVRELRNVVSHVVSMGALPEMLDRLAAEWPDIDVDADKPFVAAKRRMVAAFERDYLATQLEAAENNISEAARRSGIDRGYFKRLMRKHGL